MSDSYTMRCLELAEEQALTAELRAKNLALANYIIARDVNSLWSYAQQQEAVGIACRITGTPRPKKKPEQKPLAFNFQRRAA